ncbi:MAG: hypothetical protein ACLGSD_19635 [Acidobacteriota bacterium]
MFTHRVVARVGCLLLGVALSLSHCKGESMLDGFVTGSPGAGSLQVGSTVVTLTASTLCRMQYTGWFKVDYGAGVHSVRFLQLFTSNRGKPAPFPCTTARYHVGARLRAKGYFVASRRFEAHDITIYSIEPPPEIRGVVRIDPDPSHIALQPSLARWIDGYPMRIGLNTTILSAPPTTRLEFRFDTTPVTVEPRVQRHTPVVPSTVAQIIPGTWAAYQANISQGMIRARQIVLWPTLANAKRLAYQADFKSTIAPPIASHGIARSIIFSGSTPITLVSNRRIQEYVAKIGMALVPPPRRKARAGDVRFSFYVVRAFPARLGRYFVETDGYMPHNQLLKWNGHSSSFLYHRPSSRMIVRDVVGSPDGTILIPDSVLARLHNVAQLGALLAYAIEGVLQEQSFTADPVKVVPNLLERNSASEYASSSSGPVGIWETEQMTRLGILRMYMAGFDIREAPYAWTVGEGVQAENPVINGGRRPYTRIPGYAAYAFDMLASYYSDIDYSRLKRGTMEYAHFLQRLRKVDPGAFEHTN